MAWVGLLGGLGLFLLGMAFLTEGLQAALASRVKRVLRKLTKNRFAAFGTGAVVTAIIQSSSATSLITIGLVGAGLLTLSQAIGVLIGSNVGTTATAYLVSFVGLKFSVSTIAMPFVGIGGLARVFARGRSRIIADLLLGFGLLFVGIDFMQTSMTDLAARIDLAALAGPGFRGAAALVITGVILTALMQSSSAAMAVTLTALAGGAIDTRMGAYLVIGQNIGTTITAVIGAVGASIDARRTAGAHLVFNVGTGIAALIVLPILLRVAVVVADDPAIALSVFHTLFNVLGAVIFLPLTAVMARGLQRVMPSKGDALTQHLDQSSLRVAASSSEAVHRTIAAITQECMALVAARVAGAPGRAYERRMRELRDALEAAQDYIEDARRDWNDETIGAAISALDHLRNIALDLYEAAPLERFRTSPRVRPFAVAYQQLEAQVPAILDGSADATPVLKGLGDLTKLRKRLRGEVVADLAKPGVTDVRGAQSDLEALHWFDRIAWHLRRALQGWVAMEPREDPAPPQPSSPQ